MARKKKDPTRGPFPSALLVNLIVVGVLELRHRLELLLSAAHHGMVWGPIIGVSVRAVVAVVVVVPLARWKCPSSFRASWSRAQ